MLKDVIIKKKTLHFDEPFQIAYEKVETADVVIIKITDNQGKYGLGSAAPDKEVTGETIDKVYNILLRKLNKEFFEFPVSDWLKYHEKIQSEFRNFPSAASSVEEAILNLFASQNKITLFDIFGHYRQKCPIVITIGIKSIDKTLQEVRGRLKEGFKIIKLKCGLDWRKDVVRIKAAKQILPHQCQLILDANQGYTLSQAINFIKSISRFGISLIEQPVSAKDIIGLKKLTQLKSVPIIADESAVSLDDAKRLLSGNYVDGINIKLMKCGGPINFIEIFRLARSFKKIVIVGCMYESNISITTGASLALALPIDYVDLDSGHLDFSDDPVQGGASVKKGEIFIKDKLKLNF